MSASYFYDKLARSESRGKYIAVFWQFALGVYVFITTPLEMISTFLNVRKNIEAYKKDGNWPPLKNNIEDEDADDDNRECPLAY